MNITTEENKKAVRRFNTEFLEGGNLDALYELVSPDFVNHTAPPGAPANRDGMIYFLKEILRTAFPDLTVEIFDQIAEGDKVTTRKALRGTHTGPLMDIPATNKKIQIDVIDIVTLRDGKYIEHWGMSNLSNVISELGGK